MGQIHVVTTRLPLLVIRFDGEVDDAIFDRYLAQTEQNLFRGQRYVMLVDAIHAGVASPPQRRRQTDFIKTHHAELQRTCMGCAFVIKQPLVRGVLTAILWTQSLPFDYVVVSSVELAETWCAMRMPRAA